MVVWVIHHGSQLCELQERCHGADVWSVLGSESCLSAFQAKLKNHINNPSAVDLVHFLFTPLRMVNTWTSCIRPAASPSLLPGNVYWDVNGILFQDENKIYFF